MKTFDTRIKIKHDTTSNWLINRTFIPLNGEMIVYDDYDFVDGKNVPGIKIGDGSTPAVDLPFIDTSVRQDLLNHINDAFLHVTSEDRTRWNNKLNCDYELETLIFNRN